MAYDEKYLVKDNFILPILRRARGPVQHFCYFCNIFLMQFSYKFLTTFEMS